MVNRLDFARKITKFANEDNRASSHPSEGQHPRACVVLVT